MDWIHNLSLGMGVALAPIHVLYALAGSLLGILVGVLPGIGAVAAMAIAMALAMLLPASAALPVLILLTSIYFGTHYGRATAAYLARGGGGWLGRSPSADAALAVHQGRPAGALAVAGVASLFAGVAGLLCLAWFAPALTQWALQSGPVEQIALMLLVLVASVVLASGPLLKSIAMLVLGLLLGLVGVDMESGATRFSLGVPELANGVGLVVIALGLFAYADIISTLVRAQPEPVPARAEADLQALWPSRQDLNDAAPAALRGSVLGCVLGVLPGGGALLASWAASGLEKRLGPADGAAPGASTVNAVAAPEAADKAGALASFMPLLALGIPSSAAMALMAGAVTLYHIQPGSHLIEVQPDFIWGWMASMGIANLMLVVLSLAGARVWGRLRILPYRWLYPALVLLCALAAYSTHNSMVDIWLLAAFGMAGYVFHQLGLAPVPLLLGFVVAPTMEFKLRMALLLSDGDWGIFMAQPLSASLLAAALFLLVAAMLLPLAKTWRAAVFGRA